MLPYIRKFWPAGGGPLLPQLWEPAWRVAAKHTCVFESGKNGRYTIVGIDPVEVIAGKGNEGRIYERPMDGSVNWAATGRTEGPPLEQVRAWLRPWKSPQPEEAP